MRSSTRRQFAGSLAAVLGAFTMPVILRADSREQSMQQLPPRNPNDPRTALHQEVELPASAPRIANVLLDGKQFAALTGLPATIDGREGGAFSMFGGLIVGRTVEIVAGQRIVQAWRPTDWPSGIYSIVKFEFKPSGSGTVVVFDHTAFPAGEYDHLTAGWNLHYWEPMKKFFA
ncbi:MAG TPA: SRPBCC family protein [Acidobacteriaceae bacterium]|nr:SRPBCC family protein [Acidobacteriaceae bacterium]